MTLYLDVEKISIAQARTGKTLAELGISENTMYRANKGKPVRPTTLHKIANALGVDPAELVKDDD